MRPKSSSSPPARAASARPPPARTSRPASRCTGKKTVAIDFDVGLRNLDLVMGCERRVVYDFVNVIKGEAKLQQALIRDKRIENLYVLPASQTRDKDALDPEGVGRVINELKEMGFEYIICDSPAGIEKGAQMAMYFADEAIVVTNPEVSSVRDSDRVLGLLAAKTNRAEIGRRADPDAPAVDALLAGQVQARRDAVGGRRARAPRHPVPRRHPRVEGGPPGVEQGHAGDPRRDDRRGAGLPRRRLSLPRRRAAAPLHRAGEARLPRSGSSVSRRGGDDHHGFPRLLQAARRRAPRSPRIGCRSSSRASAR